MLNVLPLVSTGLGRAAEVAQSLRLAAVWEFTLFVLVFG